MTAPDPTADTTADTTADPADGPLPDPTDGPGVLRVLIVDDQALMRSGFALMLSAEDDLEVVGEAADGAEAIRRCAELHPDVVLMDVRMPVLDGIAATRRIVAEGESRVLILTTFDEDRHLFDALQAGAAGFLLKNSEPEALVEAVRVVGHGHALLAPEVTRRVIERLAAPAGPAAPAVDHAVTDPVAPAAEPAGAPDPGPAEPVTDPVLATLTAREREVLALLARGHSNAEIAAHLVVGEATVKTHVSSCLAKLGVRDRVQAVVAAYERGLIRPAG